MSSSSTSATAMNSKEMDVPTRMIRVTSLVVGNEPPNGHRSDSKSERPWIKPFLELLGLLGITDKSRPALKIDDQRLCFYPSHDFSVISRIFLSVYTSDFQYDIDLNTIRIKGSDFIPLATIKLWEYVNSVLQRNRVSIFTHPRTRCPNQPLPLAIQRSFTPTRPPKGPCLFPPR